MFGLDPSRSLGQASESQPQTTADLIAHFSETLTVPTRSGIAKKLAVEIDDWDFPIGDSEFDAPPDCSVILWVRQGSLSATIAGDSKTYRTGDSWTLPRGAHMSVSLQSAHDSAIVRTIVTIPLTDRRKSTVAPR
jgi:hypothetical protein